MKYFIRFSYKIYIWFYSWYKIHFFTIFQKEKNFAYQQITEAVNSTGTYLHTKNWYDCFEQNGFANRQRPNNFNWTKYQIIKPIALDVTLLFLCEIKSEIFLLCARIDYRFRKKIGVRLTAKCKMRSSHSNKIRKVTWMNTSPRTAQHRCSHTKRIMSPIFQCCRNSDHTFITITNTKCALQTINGLGIKINNFWCTFQFSIYALISRRTVLICVCYDDENDYYF